MRTNTDDGEVNATYIHTYRVENIYYKIRKNTIFNEHPVVKEAIGVSGGAGGVNQEEVAGQGGDVREARFGGRAGMDVEGWGRDFSGKLEG